MRLRSGIGEFAAVRPSDLLRQQFSSIHRPRASILLTARGHAARKILVRFATVLAAMNRAALPAAARHATALMNAVKP